MKEKKYLQRLFVALTIIIGINVWIGTSGETEVKAANITQPTPINQVFPDANLAEVMKGTLQKPNVSTPVTQDELNAVEKVEKGRNIASIEGVQYLNNLRVLRLTGMDNSISDLRPLSGLTNLTILAMGNNQVNDLTPLSGLTNLKELSMNQNQINDINALSGLTSLVSMDLSENQITDISALSNLTNLQVLHMLLNEISDISPLSSLKNLTSLDLTGNQISDISSVSSLTNLVRLHLQGNQIKDVSSLSSLTDLELLDVINNQISDISSLKSLKNLIYLWAESQTIVNRPVNYQENLVLLNNNRDITGELVSPEGISNDGSYTSPHITWSLPDYKKQVSYTFSNGELEFGAFSGTVIQPLIEAPVAYNVLFNVDGVETNETVELDSLLTSPTAPIKEGYTFIGWYDEKTGGTEWDFATDKMPAKDITLYAQFSKNSSDEGTPGDKGQDGETGGKDGTTDKPTESDLQPVDKPTNNSPQLKDTQSTLSAKAKHVSGSKEQGAKEKSSLPVTGDDSIFTLYLQAIGVLFLVAFFWISHKRKKVRNEK
ncbi:leucine-rich repeat domain-containing protein [Listeria monocytogenes]|uniref:leucine-rich repeat domain-containing protein n=1 Tax=Listeria monocytogenes TaxID=1639 RepID=UPI001E62E654|nr:leucine-rich repeat domain-containing protein [Listeria monocytogenes]MCD2211614.1 leucine-rich repeat domain-containing protein [Listeria monocytogenes]MCD2220005.1 leucine-rich repeat domain-containing protein [Listeria monocytogenes]